MDMRPVGLALVLAAWMGGTASGRATAESPPPVRGMRAFFDERVQEHLELGLRFSAVSLRTHDKWDSTGRHGFVGTISHLDEEQTGWPYNVSAAYWFDPHVGIDLQWEHLRAEAVTTSQDHHVDGSYDAKGPSLMAVGRLPLGGGLVPYLGVGLNFPSVDFEPEAWWRLGYSSPSDYEPGSTMRNGGKTRHMDTRADDAACLAAAAGMLWRVQENWALDVNVRYVDVEAISHHYSTEEAGKINDHGENSIQLAYYAFGAGVVYAF